MATTARRHSARLIPRTVADSTMPECDPDCDLISQEESGSDWDDSPRKIFKRAKLPATSKKAKVAAATTRGRKKAALSLLPTMPLDILFEIFSLMAPADLLSLTRTSSPLRETLLTRKAITIWRAAARDQVPDAPRCPQDMSEPAWANLLFGGYTCQMCGSLNVRRVSFVLRRRVCSFCLKIDLVHSGKLSKKFPALDPLVMDLIPHTTARGLGCTSHSESKFYWLGDIEDMARTLDFYQKDIQMQKVGAIQALENFKQARMQLVEDVTSYAQGCEEWLENAIWQRSARFNKLSRLNAIKTRFLELGYVEHDLEHLQFQHEANSATQLTDRIWNRIRPILEPDVQQRKADRLAPYLPYNCLECLPGSTRVFKLRGIRDHLKAKHGILEMQEGVHFREVVTP